MILTGRSLALLLCGAVPTVLRPEFSTVWAWAALCLVLVVADAVAAGSPRAIALTRVPSQQVRLGEMASTTLLVSNTSRRRFRGVLRDAWQPSAGATGNRHALVLPPGERRAVTTRLRPTRRGDRLADRV